MLKSFLNEKCWLHLMNESIFVTWILYAIKFYDTVGLEVIVIQFFFAYSYPVRWLTKKFIYEGQHRVLSFFVLYTPHLIYSIWFALWGISHSWVLSLLYPVILIICYIKCSRVLFTQQNK